MLPPPIPLMPTAWYAHVVHRPLERVADPLALVEVRALAQALLQEALLDQGVHGVALQRQAQYSRVEEPRPLHMAGRHPGALRRCKSRIHPWSFTAMVGTGWAYLEWELLERPQDEPALGEYGKEVQHLG